MGLIYALLLCVGGIVVVFIILTIDEAIHPTYPAIDDMDQWAEDRCKYDSKTVDKWHLNGKYTKK